MKFFSFSFLILNLAFGKDTSTQSKCSNADATVQYATKNGEQNLFVTVRNVNSDGTEVLAKQELKNFLAKEEKNILIQTIANTNCDQIDSNEGILTIKSLNFRKVTFRSKNGAEFQNNIVGLLSDKKTLTVDYLCETTTESAISCD